MNHNPQQSFSFFMRSFFRQHKLILLALGLILVVQFILFKSLYPHAILTYDSSFYVDGAARNLDVNYWPIGYSKILRLFHALVPSDWVVVLFQYLLLEASVLIFYFTVLYLLHPGKWVTWTILLFISINPILLIISNYILSDAIFTALTILWFTLLLWLMFRPRALQVYLLALLLILLYTIRYYAVFYPLFTLVIVLFSRISWWTKTIGLGLGGLLFLGFNYYTAVQYSKLLGHRESSPFSGWRLAENALIMYKNIPDYSIDYAPASLQPLHNYVTHALDSIHKENTPQEQANVFYYMTDSSDLLIGYMQSQFRNDSLTDQFKKWASMGKLYHQYGAFLIKKHPLAFVRWYMGQGVQWYMMPTLEISNEFETGSYWIPDQAKEWFGYTSNILPCTTTKVFSAQPYVVMMCLSNGLMLLSAIGFFLLGCYKSADREIKMAILLAASFWLVNFIFNVVAAPAMMRYGLPMMIINLTFGLVQAEWVWRNDRKPDPNAQTTIPLMQ